MKKSNKNTIASTFITELYELVKATYPDLLTADETGEIAPFKDVRRINIQTVPNESPNYFDLTVTFFANGQMITNEKTVEVQ